MKIILEFPGETVEEAMDGVRAFAEAWANVYANAALPRQLTVGEIQAETRRRNSGTFIDEVSALEQREDLKPATKPEPKPANPVRRKQVEAAFRTMVGKYGGESDALKAGRVVLEHIGAVSVPAIPEAKLAECLALLNISECYPTAAAFIERLQSHEAAA